mmetsp:Transcript_26256/g.55321  ORF Transcript_26256/g.55321 Transcript_26256/m.55321 type:complete len:266 (+) Transcript_26256:678-1475(+)
MEYQSKGKRSFREKGHSRHASRTGSVGSKKTQPRHGRPILATVSRHATELRPMHERRHPRELRIHSSSTRGNSRGEKTPLSRKSKDLIARVPFPLSANRSKSGDTETTRACVHSTGISRQSGYLSRACPGVVSRIVWRQQTSHQHRRRQISTRSAGIATRTTGRGVESFLRMPSNPTPCLRVRSYGRLEGGRKPHTLGSFLRTSRTRLRRFLPEAIFSIDGGSTGRARYFGEIGRIGDCAERTPPPGATYESHVAEEMCEGIGSR